MYLSIQHNKQIKNKKNCFIPNVIFYIAAEGSHTSTWGIGIKDNFFLVYRNAVA